MDAVILYVDGNDPAWRADYEKYTDIPLMDKRFRDWGTLRYLFRGIGKFMPFVDRIFLVVSHPSQAPEWVSGKVNVVLHKDFMPAELLPSFNSTAIETCIPLIEGLGEKFLYFNDDMYPVAPSAEDDFFEDGKAAIGFSRHLLAMGMYKENCKASDKLAREALGMKPGLTFARPQHICSPMLLDDCRELWDKASEKIISSQSMLREGRNVNQYIYLDYMLYKGTAVNRRLSSKHISLAATTASVIHDSIVNPSTKLLCINDVHLGEAKFEQIRECLLDSFEEALPEKSRFEK